MLLVVVASLRCVRAQRRRAHCGLLVPLSKLVSTLLALREASAIEMNRRYGATAAHALLPCAALARANISLAPVLLQPSLAYLAAATSKAELRLCEPSLGVTTDPATPRTWTSRAAITIELLAGLCSLKAQIGGARVSRTMAVPDKVALGLFFFWWHGSSVRALPSSIPRMPLLLHRVLTRAPDARCRGAPGYRNQM